MFVCKDQKMSANMLPKTIVEASVARLKPQKKLVNCFRISVCRYGKQVNYFSISVFCCLFSTELQRISYTRADL